MIAQQEELVKNARDAIIALLDSGVTQGALIDALSDAVSERQLCIDATEMVNKIFAADARWLARMCEEEIKQRKLSEV